MNAPVRTPKRLPARCRICGGGRCDQTGSDACWEAQTKRLGDE